MCLEDRLWGCERMWTCGTGARLPIDWGMSTQGGDGQAAQAAEEPRGGLLGARFPGTVP